MRTAIVELSSQRGRGRPLRAAPTAQTPSQTGWPAPTPRRGGGHVTRSEATVAVHAQGRPGLISGSAMLAVALRDKHSSPPAASARKHRERLVANSIVRRATSSWAKQSSAAGPADTCWSGQGLVRRACAGLLGCMSVCLELAVPLRGVTAHDVRARPGRGRVSQRLAHSGTERECNGVALPRVRLTAHERRLRSHGIQSARHSRVDRTGG